MAISPLFDAKESQCSRPGNGLTIRWEGTVVNSLVHENDKEKPAKPRQASAHPKCYRPFCLVDDESCKHGSQIGRYNDASRPDVDLSSSHK